jgi:mRNA-degrading endonuclease RelE of RelBE toxin-antitoxin system
MYQIDFTVHAEAHFATLTARQRSIVMAGIEENLRHEPHIETRNRKLMQPNLLATWELRLGNIRVYYDIENEPDLRVVVQAIGVKVRNQVYIGGVAYDFGTAI